MTDTAPTQEAIQAFAARIVDEGTILDPWNDGAPRFLPDPYVLTAATATSLDRAAEAVAWVWDEVGRIVADGENEALLDDFFHLTPTQRAMWLASEPRWHGIARADIFLTADGPRVAELNCDTPTGQAETVVLAGLLFEQTAKGRPVPLLDPSRSLAERWIAMISAFAARISKGQAASAAGRTAGIVYPTELTEDLPLVRIYRKWLEAAGYHVVLGSPFNLEKQGDNVSLFDEPISLLLRHYKTDWWGERESAWDDERIADSVPLVGPLTAVLEAQVAGRCAVVNPFGSVLQQNKRSMAFMWEHVHRFSMASQAIIEKYIPPTFRAEALHSEQLLAQRAEWVLKSDYGAEGRRGHRRQERGRRAVGEVARARAGGPVGGAAILRDRAGAHGRAGQPRRVACGGAGLRALHALLDRADGCAGVELGDVRGVTKREPASEWTLAPVGTNPRRRRSPAGPTWGSWVERVKAAPTRLPNVGTRSTYVGKPSTCLGKPSTFLGKPWTTLGTWATTDGTRATNVAAADNVVHPRRPSSLLGCTGWLRSIVVPSFMTASRRKGPPQRGQAMVSGCRPGAALGAASAETHVLEAY